MCVRRALNLPSYVDDILTVIDNATDGQFEKWTEGSIFLVLFQGLCHLKHQASGANG